MLAAADFKSDEATGDKDRVCLGNELTVDGEPIAAGEERKFRFVVADLDSERGSIGIGDIGRVGDDDVEGLACDRRKKIALKKTDSISDSVLLRVGSRHGKGRG